MDQVCFISQAYDHSENSNNSGNISEHLPHFASGIQSSSQMPNVFCSQIIDLSNLNAPLYLQDSSSKPMVAGEHSSMILSQDTRSRAEIDNAGVGAGGSLRGYLTNFRDISEAKKQISKYI